MFRTHVILQNCLHRWIERLLLCKETFHEPEDEALADSVDDEGQDEAQE